MSSALNGSNAPRLLGQTTAETLLARAIQREQIGHAYLFLGPSGCGKSTAARLFAQAINCERQPAVAEGSGFGVQGSEGDGIPAFGRSGVQDDTQTPRHPHTHALRL